MFTKFYSIQVAVLLKRQCFNVANIFIKKIAGLELAVLNRQPCCTNSSVTRITVLHKQQSHKATYSISVITNSADLIKQSYTNIRANEKDRYTNIKANEKDRYTNIRANENSATQISELMKTEQHKYQS